MHIIESMLARNFREMNNPFEQLNERLNKIEGILLHLTKEPKQEENADELLMIEDAAKFLNLAVPTIYGKVSNNSIPYNKQGKRLYFLKSELIEYIKQGRNKTNLEIEKEAESYLSK